MLTSGCNTAGIPTFPSVCEDNAVIEVIRQIAIAPVPTQYLWSTDVMERCRCILSSRAFLWLLFSFAAFGACLISFLSPEWLMGHGRTRSEATESVATPGTSQESTAAEQKIGPLKSCRYRAVEDEVPCLFLTWESLESAAWKSSVILQGAGTIVVFFAVVLGVVSFWKQNLGRFNIISVAGLLEGVAGEILIM